MKDRSDNPQTVVTPVVGHWVERETTQWVHHEGSIRRPTDRIPVTPVVGHWVEREIAQWVHHEGSIRRPTDRIPVTPVVDHWLERELRGALRTCISWLGSSRSLSSPSSGSSTLWPRCRSRSRFRRVRGVGTSHGMDGRTHALPWLVGLAHTFGFGSGFCTTTT